MARLHCTGIQLMTNRPNTFYSTATLLYAIESRIRDVIGRQRAMLHQVVSDNNLVPQMLVPLSEISPGHSA